MVILGLIDSKPSAAAILVDGQIVSAVAEERLCRMKMATGMPREAIQAAMDKAGVQPSDIDAVAAAQNALAFRAEPAPWTGWFASQGQAKPGLTRLGASVAPLVGRWPVAWRAHHGVKRALLRDRRHKLPALMQSAYAINAPVHFFDHHFCHAASAYYSSNFAKALVITMDGGGDGRSASVYIGDQGKLRHIASVDSYNSLGNFYSYITEICGFHAERHEGKVTGLAALGEPRYADTLRTLIEYRAPGQIRYAVPMYHTSALRAIKASLPSDFDRADLAASAQLVLEEIATQFISHWIQHTGISDVAVAGGVFANVKLNQRVNALENLRKLFIYPAMDDSGLAAGGALACAARLSDKPEDLIHRLDNVYLGNEYGAKDVEQAMAGRNYKVRQESNVHKTIAELLASGHVVARYTGAMEYGPRALGHRSVLYQTGDPSVNDWLNERLKRTEFMPFAPATLIERADECYIGLEGAMDPARFMTITCDCTDTMKKNSGGVVHVDGTARPQLVDKETAADFHAILTHYDALTGIPSLINTSFNMHEEPIVCSPDDAVRAFDDGRIDYIAMDHWIVEHPALAGQKRTAAGMQ